MHPPHFTCDSKNTELTTIKSQVKRAIVQLCVALADHSYVDAEGGDYVIAFLVRNLVGPTEQEAVAKKMEV
uniref:MROH2B-like HEAT-repeats domain-containing protein n=1 Tax=Caenorhabditis japonica TaxID=281687 RepID=A0A8R1EFC7_CAEJA